MTNLNSALSKLLYQQVKVTWSSEGDTIYSVPALRHYITGESRLFGKYGEISLINKHTIGVLITSAKLANKYNDELQKYPNTRIKRGDEFYVEVCSQFFLRIYEELKIGSIKSQLMLANKVEGI